MSRSAMSFALGLVSTNGKRETIRNEIYIYIEREIILVSIHGNQSLILAEIHRGIFESGMGPVKQCRLYFIVDVRVTCKRKIR